MESDRRIRPPALLRAVLVGLLLVGCSTTYQPGPSPRVGIVVHHGAKLYGEGGREHPELAAAVADNAAALAHVRAARVDRTTGTATYAVDSAYAVASLVVTGPIGLVIGGVAVLAGVGGLALMARAHAHDVDAINIASAAVP